MRRCCGHLSMILISLGTTGHCPSKFLPDTAMRRHLAGELTARGAQIRCDRRRRDAHALVLGIVEDADQRALGAQGLALPLANLEPQGIAFIARLQHAVAYRDDGTDGDRPDEADGERL